MLQIFPYFSEIFKKNHNNMRIVEKIEKLRIQMEQYGISAYIIPSSDPHQSEYVADRWKSREWISGFTGSAGTIAITLYHAALWTDSRYFLQGEEELENTGIELMKMGLPQTPSIEDWIISLLKAGDVVACDGYNFSINHIHNLENKLKQNHLILNYKIDLIDKIWNNRPQLPTSPIFEHDIQFTGKSRAQKLEEIRQRMGATDAHIISTLDDIAWTLNIRGNDVECNPLAISYCWIEKTRTYLFIDPHKISKELKSSLQKDNIYIKEYQEITHFLKALPQDYSILIHPQSLNAVLFDAIPKGTKIINGRTIATDLKTIKNSTEIAHIKQAMAKDAVALLKLFRWLEKELQHRTIPETEVAEQLIEFRKEGKDYYGESFPAIVGYNGNGAIVHYRPLPNKCAQLKNEGILLLDSGGQYHNGTTDITRTIALGEATPTQKKHFTLVLKGHIALATQHFPEGTTGLQLDTLTRQFLWKQNLNFGHGTGHGVGFFLNVHEGPQGIGPLPQGRYMEPFKEGMFTSNEPGLYLTNEYGIRIENLILAVKDNENEFGKFLKFETLTLFPIDAHLVDETILTTNEKEWLNQYHQEVFEKVSPLLNDEDDIHWLKEKCKSI